MSTQVPPINAHVGYAVPVTSASEVDLTDLEVLSSTATTLADYPHAAGVEQQVLIYDAAPLIESSDQPDRRAAISRELAMALLNGPGVIAVRAAVEPATVDAATAVLETVISAERATERNAGDHFAKPGANDRVWNSLQKLALASPEVFVDYHGNEIVDLVATAWLGPAYQLTAQANVINPGGAAQAPHRDYHLGFMSQGRAELFPLHAHLLSPVLTLQGAIAHCDMEPESGPTMLLPHSQKYPLGYLAWHRPDVIDLFNRRYRQLPLSKGDALFFNPALLHAGGQNRSSDVRRFANLLQISSAMGRAMEVVDRRRMVEAVYPVLVDRSATGWNPRRIAAAVAASAEGYPFPTNLDLDQPVDGPSPTSQQDIVFAALANGHSPADLAANLDDYDNRRTT